MHELKPKLFDIMKGYSKEQLIKDIISGIIVAIIALPLSIALAIASGVGPEQGLYTAIIADCCLRCHYLRNCRKLRNRRSDRRNHPRRYHSCDHGNLPLRFSDQVHSLHNYDRIYLRNRSHTFRRSAKRLLRNGNGICPI